MSTSETDLFHFGVIVGTHGLKGDLKVRSLTPESAVLCDATRVFVRSGDGKELLARPVRAVTHKGNILLRLQGYENINLVEGLIGHDVLMPRAEVAEHEDDSNFWQDLNGLEVIDRRCGSLGVLEDIFTTAAHDIYVVQGPFGEVLIPAVDAFVLEVDIAGNRMMVDLPEGLVPESDEN